MSDSADIDTALVQRLAGDAQLLALVPDGVWFDEAKQGLTAFVRVSLVIASDSGQMGAPSERRATEDVLYTVLAVIRNASSVTARQAAARIDALLTDQPLTIPGYHCLSVERTERLRNSETDSVDATIRWQHRGGQYRVLVTPTQ